MCHSNTTFKFGALVIELLESPFKLTSRFMIFAFYAAHHESHVILLDLSEIAHMNHIGQNKSDKKFCPTYFARVFWSDLGHNLSDI